MLVLVLLALCLLVYLPALYANPCWDDAQIFQKPLSKWVIPIGWWFNPRWLTHWTFGVTFRWAQRFREEWRPTLAASALHLGNTLIHWLNCLAVYGVARYLVGDRAIVAALIFAVHPLAASAVAPIVSRSSILSSGFIFLAIWATMAGHPFLALLLAVGAFWSKEDGVMAFFLVVALTAIVDPKTALILAGLGLLVGQRSFKKLYALTKTLLKNNGDIRMEQAGLPGSLPQPQYSATAIVENLRRWPLWFFGFELNPDPDPKPRKVSTALYCIAGLLILVCATWNTLATPLLFVAFCSPWAASWFFRLPDPVSELRAYSTLLPMAILWSYLPLPLVVPVIVWFAAISGYRCWLQQNEMALWKHAWNEGSHKLRVAINIAAALQKYGKVQDAFDAHKKALEMAPKNGLVLINAALWFEGRARLERQQAMQQFIADGRLDQARLNATVQAANQFLAQAVVLAREALQYAGGDPWVQHYSKAIEAHAAGVGMTVQTGREELVTAG